MDPDASSDTCSVSSEYSTEILREELAHTLPQLFEDLTIEYTDLEPLTDGASHLVFAFTNTASNSKQVIRVAIERAGAGETDEEDAAASNEGPPSMKDQAAVLSFLQPYASHLGCSIPRAIQFDESNVNALDHPYMIESFVPGDRLDDIWEEMPPSDQAEVVRALAKTVYSQESIEFPCSGGLQASKQSAGIEYGPIRKTFKSLDLSWNPDTSVFSWIDHLIQRKIQHWQGIADNEGDCNSKHWEIEQTLRLRDVLFEMRDCGIFDDPQQKMMMNKAVLCHPDLHFGNFFTAREDGREDGKLGVKAVIDWDDTVVLPLPLTREPPYWLWEPEGVEQDDDLLEHWNMDYDYLPAQHWSRMTDKAVAVRQVWDAEMASYDDSYLDDAYGSGLWIRRVAKFAMWGIRSFFEFDMLNWLCDEWRDYMWKEHGRRSNVRREDGSLPVPPESNADASPDHDQKANPGHGPTVANVAQISGKIHPPGPFATRMGEQLFSVLQSPAARVWKSLRSKLQGVSEFLWLRKAGSEDPLFFEPDRWSKMRHPRLSFWEIGV